jgi:peroxin-6
MMLTASSAKELEHFERIRQTFESVDKQKQDPAATAPQTIAEAMEAFSLGDSPNPEVPTSNGDNSFTGSIHDRIKGLRQWPGGIVRSASGQSTTSSKGKGKSANKKGKGSRVGAESDGSLDGDEEDLADGQIDDDEDEDEDDYVVRTDHLANPMEEVE